MAGNEKLLKVGRVYPASGAEPTHEQQAKTFRSPVIPNVQELAVELQATQLNDKLVARIASLESELRRVQAQQDRLERLATDAVEAARGSSTIEVLLRKTDEGLPTPSYAYEGDAGADLYAAESAVIPPGQCAAINTGIEVAIPVGFEMQVRPRSGLARVHGMSVLNSPGTIDSGYRGPILVLLYNHGSKVYIVNRKDPIAQVVFARHAVVRMKLVDSLPPSERGTKGFGSSSNRVPS